MQNLLGRIEHKGEQKEKSDEDRHDDVKHLFSIQSIRQSRVEKGKQNRARQNSPQFNEGNRLCARLRSRYDNCVFIGSQYVVVERNEEKNREQRQELSKLIPVNGPKKRAPGTQVWWTHMPTSFANFDI